MAKRLPPDDDGRTIVPMDDIDAGWRPGGKQRSGRADGPEPGSEATGYLPSRQETRWYMLGALKASLLVVGVFSAGIILFVLLLLWLWT